MNPKTLIPAVALVALAACSGEKAAMEEDAERAIATEPKTEQQKPTTQAYYGDEEMPEVLEAHDHTDGDDGHDHGEAGHRHEHEEDDHGHEEDDHGHDH